MGESMTKKSLKRITRSNTTKGAKSGLQHQHPGKVLAAKMKSNGHSQHFLAEKIKVDRSRLSHLISGKNSMTLDTALRLGIFYGTGAEYWLNLQIRYDIELCKVNGQYEQLEEIIKPYDGGNTQYELGT